MISHNLVDDYILNYSGSCFVQGVDGQLEKKVYKVNLSIGDKIFITNLNTLDFKGINDIDILIGLDIISRGTLLVSNDKDYTFFSFKLKTSKGQFLSDFLLTHYEEFKNDA